MSLKKKLLIDGKDAYTTWGVTLRDYSPLLSLPPFKAVSTNQWHEYDGIEADLSDPVLAGRTLSLSFNITYVRDAEDLVSDLSGGAYHTYSFPKIGRSYVLRYVSSNFQTTPRLGILTVTFADDFPPLLQAAAYPKEDPVLERQGYSLDGIDLAHYGIRVLIGSEQSSRQIPASSENLKNDLSTLDGIQYDGTIQRFASKDLTLSLLIHTDRLPDFWNRWNSFFANLTKPDERKLHSHRLDRTLSCYYKQCAVSNFRIEASGGVWCAFSLSLVVTDWSPITSYGVLSTEDTQAVITMQEQLVRIREARQALRSSPSVATADVQVSTTIEGSELIKITELPAAEDLAGLVSIGVDRLGESVQFPIGDLLVKAIEKGGIRRLTYNQFNSLSTKDGLTLYAVVSEGGDLRYIYLGDTLIAKRQTDREQGFPYTFPIIF